MILIELLCPNFGPILGVEVRLLGFVLHVHLCLPSASASA